MPFGIVGTGCSVDCLRFLPTHWLPPANPHVRDTPCLDAVQNLGTNYAGHSYLNRYYLFGLPGFVHDTDVQIIQTHLKMVADDLVSFFNNGIQLFPGK